MQTQSYMIKFFVVLATRSHAGPTINVPELATERITANG